MVFIVQNIKPTAASIRIALVELRSNLMLPVSYQLATPTIVTV